MLDLVRIPSRATGAAVLAVLLPLALPLALSLASATLARADDTETPAAQAEAREIFASTCVSCHGPGGHGDGLASAGLPIKPASFADPAWQKATSDTEIERAIVGGGAAVGKSPLMPPNAALADKPAVLAALTGLIRSFGAQGGSPAGAR